MIGQNAAASDYYIFDLAILLIAVFDNLPFVNTILRSWRWFTVWYRRRRQDPTRYADALILTILLLLSAKDRILEYLAHPVIFRFFVAKVIAAVLLYYGSLFYTWHTRGVQAGWSAAILKQDAMSTPWIVPSKTTHTRLFPKKHSFAYSYLTVAIPVGFKGWCWPMLSVDADYAKCWFHVQASDHLGRGNRHMGLKDKLTQYLRAEGVQDAEWAYAYLVTAPRFLGYSFNPVSFWYIYDEKRALKKMILEVNNTFDERRMYLLEGQASESGLEGGKFKQTWAKDFHVSPFNSRKGSYSLSASDPFLQDGNAIQPIDNTIVMSSSKGHGKIVARLLSVGDPVNPRQLSRMQSLSFLARWWWVGYFTFPRILYEAVRLFFRRRLHVWFRPEVLNTSIGRNASSVEYALQPIVDKYILNIVRTSSVPVSVRLERPDGSCSELKPTKLAGLADEGEWKSLDIRILTPAFYSRFPHYIHTREAFDREAIFTDVKNRTASVSDHSVLNMLLADVDRTEVTQSLTWSQRTRWSLHGRLRCPAPTQAYADSLTSPGYMIKDIRPSPLSSLDRFVMRKHVDGWLYLRCCARLFLAERLAFGLVPVVDAADIMARICLCYFFTVPAITAAALQPKMTQLFDMGVLAILADLVGLWALHLYSMAKGLPG